MSSCKVAVVTGSNKGIGFGIVKGLCEKFQGIVYLTARDVTRGEAAVAKLRELGFKPEFHQLDIRSKDSITKLRDFFVEKHGGLDLLVNNAEVKSFAPYSFSERAQITVGINYFATLQVCEVLFPILKLDARVVNLSSSAGHLSRIPSSELRAKFKDPNLTVAQLNELMGQFIQDARDNKHEEVGWGNSYYVVSKVGVNALTRIQQKEFNNSDDKRNISVNSVHSGYVNMDLTQRKGPWTLEEGARAALFVALEAENLKGQHVLKDTTVAEWDSDPPVTD